MKKELSANYDVSYEMMASVISDLNPVQQNDRTVVSLYIYVLKSVEGQIVFGGTHLMDSCC